LIPFEHYDVTLAVNGSPPPQHARIAATASSALSFRLLMNTPTLLTRCSVSTVGRCRPTLPLAPAWHTAHVSGQTGQSAPRRPSEVTAHTGFLRADRLMTTVAGPMHGGHTDEFCESHLILAARLALSL